MPKYMVVIQPEAEMDLDEAFEDLESRSQGVGIQFLANLTETLELLEENPFLFQKIYKDFRRAIVRRFGFNILYKVVGTEVIIFAIIHGRRNPKRWQNRG